MLAIVCILAQQAAGWWQRSMVCVERVLGLTCSLSECMDKLLPSELIVTGGKCCIESMCKSSLICCSAFLV